MCRPTTLVQPSGIFQTFNHFRFSLVFGTGRTSQFQFLNRDGRGCRRRIGLRLRAAWPKANNINTPRNFML